MLRRESDQRQPRVRPGEAQAILWLAEYAQLHGRAQNSALENRRLSELQSLIAEHYHGLVESIARRFIGSGEPLEDLVQEGFLGLLSALDHYDPNKKVKFSTYATHFVAGAIRHCLRDRGKIIKEPAWLHELSGKINKAKEALTQDLGRAPFNDEIAQFLNLTEAAVEEIIATRQVFQVASFDSDPDSDASGVVDPEKITSDKYVTFHLPADERIVLESAVDKLKALEQKVLYEFFYKDLNQTEIAKQMGISCNYVSHIIKNSTKKLKKILGEAEATDRGRARESSIIEPQTGLYTALHVRGRVDEEISRALRANRPLSIILIELTELPTNARSREELLQNCGVALRAAVRKVDIVGCLHVDADCCALLVVLPQTGEQSYVVADRLLGVLTELSLRASEPCAWKLGRAIYPEQGRNFAELAAHARDNGYESPALAAA